MGRNKRKAFGTKAKASEKKTNPFDLKFTTQKRSIIGSAKSGTGAPLITKKRAFQERKRVLGTELRKLGKANQIKDRRIGEKNPNLTSAQKAELRFVAQRKHLFSGKNKFLLGDQDDSLDHLTRNLTQTEKFQKQNLHQEDDEVDSDMFTAAHFGGGNITNTKRDKEGKKLTRKEMLEQIIQSSKESKAIKQKEREVQFETWKRLDAKFVEVAKAGELDFGREKEQQDDDYMTLYRQLQEDTNKAVALDPKKDPKLKAEFDARRIEKQEAERMNRMHAGEHEIVPHESVDDDTKRSKKKDKKVSFELVYDKDGKLILPAEKEQEMAPEKRIVRSADEEPEYTFDSDDEYDQLIDDEGIEDDELEDEEDDEAEDEDSVLDEEEDAEGSDQEDTESSSQSKQKLPVSEEQLHELLEHTPVEQYIPTFETIVKQNNPKKNEICKKKVGEICGWLVEEFVQRSENQNRSNQATNTLIEVICNFAKNVPDACAERCHDIASVMYSSVKANHRENPNKFHILAFARLVRTLFTVSDRVHSVCLPTQLTVLTVLMKTRFYSSLDLAKCLLLCDEMALWVEESKRYCPEVMNFLLGTLILATKSNMAFPSGGFPLSEPHRQMLHFATKSKVKQIPPMSVTQVFTTEDADKLNKNRITDLQVIRLTVRLVKYFAELYQGINEAYSVLFRKYLDVLQQLPVNNYPSGLASEVQEVTEYLDKAVKDKSEVRQLTHAVSKKIKMIDMLEPKIEEHFNVRHPSHRRSDPKAHEKRLTKKVKKETRSAVKELRMDARFLAGEQQRQNQEVSRERIEKTKRILAGLQTQESEYQKRKKTKH